MLICQIKAMLKQNQQQQQPVLKYQQQPEHLQPRTTPSELNNAM